MTDRRWLWIILGLALAARLGWGLTRPDDAAAIEALPDQREYLLLGRSLLRGEGLRFVDPRFDDAVFAYRTPGYPMLIASAGGSVTIARVAQALIDTSTILAVFLLTRALGAARRTSLLAAGIAAVNPIAIYFSALLLTETLFTAMLIWGMALLARLRNLLPGGIVLALAALVRPSAVALPALLGAMAWLAGTRPSRRDAPFDRTASLPRREALRSIAIVAGMALLTAAVLTPWAIRNHALLGRWVWTTTNEGITAYDGFGPDATGASDQRFTQRMPELARMNEIERNDYFKRLAREAVAGDPPRALRLAAVKIARTWSPVPLSAEYGGRSLYLLVAGAYATPLFLLAIAGLFASPPGRGGKWFLAAPMIYFTAVHAMSVGSLRYRFPVEPLLAVSAAAGLMWIWNGMKPPGHARDNAPDARRDAPEPSSPAEAKNDG